jgi:hypothetical protein
MAELTVHTMPIEALRARAREAQRLLAQAREITRASFDRESEASPPSSEESHPSRRVGVLLDAAQRLLPGMPPLADEHAYALRAKPSDSGLRRVTLRGGAERALESIERAEIVESVAREAAGLVAEIERRSSSTFRVADALPAGVRVTREA